MITLLIPTYQIKSNMSYINNQLDGLKTMNPTIVTLDRCVSGGDRIYSVYPRKKIGKILTTLSEKLVYINKKIYRNNNLWQSRIYKRNKALKEIISKTGSKLLVIHFMGMAVSFVKYIENAQVPVVIICHESELAFAKNDASYHKKMLRVFKYAARIICVSEYIRGILLELGCSKEILEVVYLGGKIPQISKKTDRTENEEIIRFISVGRLVPIKGYELLIETFKTLKRIRKNIQLFIVGNGPLYGYLVNLISKYNLEDSVTMLGSLENRQVLDYLQGCDVYIQPSINEALGISIVEAMSVGLPVIASNVGGIPELVLHEKTGLLVEPSCLESIVNAMLKMMDDARMRVEMGRAGRKRIEQNFDVDIQNKKFMEIFQEMI